MSKRLSRLKAFLFQSVTVFQRDKPYVKVVYLGKNRNAITSEQAIPFELKGCVLDDDDLLRKIQLLGGGTSHAVTFPAGWLNSVSREGYVKSRLVHDNRNGEISIIVYKPKMEEMKA